MELFLVTESIWLYLTAVVDDRENGVKTGY